MARGPDCLRKESGAGQSRGGRDGEDEEGIAGVGKRPQHSPREQHKPPLRKPMWEPPYYILCAHSPLSSSTPGALSNTLAHPAIQYHYQDDSPLSLLPQYPDEHVLVLDYDSDPNAQSTVQSLSKTLVATGLRIEEAPGAATADAKNDRMYIIETTEFED